MNQNELPVLGFGYCHLSAAPLRAEPGERSEMISQLLFGETLMVIEKHHSWRRIRCTFDNYEGWIDKKQFDEIAEAEFMRVAHLPNVMSNELVQILFDLNGNRMFPLLIGSSLPGLAEQQLTIAGNVYSYEGSVVCPTNRIFPQQVIDTAHLYLHAPYLWGGRNPFGIDCSGFVQMVYKLCGIALMRDTNQQATQGEVVNLHSESRPGDLAFFDNDEEQITHVGILIDQNNIIHASGLVKINQFDHFGIFEQLQKKYTHKLRIIKRIL
ncbi:MAG: C40 family peptidase [Bacteroidales bacterium]|nr:C40 family peptidase [Bacteroidales bacterium]